jgi:hypothetical protein
LTSIARGGPNIDRLEVAELKTDEEVPKRKPVLNPTIDDEWHLVCLSLDEKTEELYLDGALLSSKPSKGKPPPSGGILLDGFNGNPKYYLDELCVYERTLSEEEIMRMFKVREEAGK